MAAANQPKTSSISRLRERAVPTSHQGARIIEIDVEKLRFDVTQPRKAFHPFDGIVKESDQKALEDLAVSIEINGLLHPITVQELADGNYLVRIGERRSRAHMILKRQKIQAVVRNDLDTSIKTLAVQLAENTDRENLTDREIADAIMRLLSKSAENPQPMTRAEIAKMVGKSAGWVTRYVNFAEPLLQEKWVVPGYVESPEVLYQLSILDEELQNQLYGELASGELSPPLRTRNIAYAKEVAANRRKMNDDREAAAGKGSGAAPASDQNAAASNTNSAGGDGGADTHAAIMAAMTGGQPVVSPKTPPTAAIPTPEAGGYSVDPDKLAGLRVPTFQGGSASSPGGEPSMTPVVLANTAVPARMPVSRLLEVLQNHGGELEGLDKLLVDMRLPSSMAVALVRALSGETVEEATVQVRLAKLLSQQ